MKASEFQFEDGTKKVLTEQDMYKVYMYYKRMSVAYFLKDTHPEFSFCKCFAVACDVVDYMRKQDDCYAEDDAITYCLHHYDYNFN